ncbi:MAG: glycosyltransferase family 39 protein [Planctomycetota bacterium]|nr:glycosyltransferase family 39 protein [Planctomycetota bacterium]
MSEPPTELESLHHPPDRFRHYLLVLPIIALALFVRLSTLDAASLWCDEIGQVTSYYFDSYKDVMYWAARWQPPPLDYWVGWSVYKFAQGEFAARLPAAIFGTLTVLIAYLLARRMVGRGAALLIALGLATSPHMIHYSQEARPYAMFWFTLLLSVWLLARAWERNRLRDWVLFLPVIACCLLTRSLGALMMTTGMGLWALADLVRRFRSRRERFFRDFFRHHGTRLSICLLIAWAPALHIMQFILHRSRKFGYLARDAGETFDWYGNTMAVGQALKAVVTSAMPIGIVLVPLGVAGMAWFLLRQSVAKEKPQRVILAPVLMGFFIHAVVYALMVNNWNPKYVYWGYVLPFVYLGAGYAVERLTTLLLRRSPLPIVANGAWLAVAVVLLFQLRIDHTTAIVHKPDWRAACEAIGAKVNPKRDVVFAAEAQVYGTAGMVFRVSPHYWETDEHLVNVLREQDKLYNGGRPILDRRSCRVALMLRCDPDLDGELLRQRMSKTSRLTFSVRDFHQFLVLISRPRFETADAGLLALADAVEQMLGDDHRDFGVHVQMARAWVLAKHGDFEQAAATYARARQQVMPQHLPGFDGVYEELSNLIDASPQIPVRLTTAPNSSS